MQGEIHRTRQHTWDNISSQRDSSNGPIPLTFVRNNLNFYARWLHLRLLASAIFSIKYPQPTLLPLLRALMSSLRSTRCLRSRFNLFPKLWNMVEPPESTMFYQEGLRSRINVKQLRANLIQTTTNIYRWTLNDVVNNLGERGQEIRWIDFWVEENFRGQETFITDIDPILL